MTSFIGFTEHMIRFPVERGDPIIIRPRIPGFRGTDLYNVLQVVRYDLVSADSNGSSSYRRD